MEQNLTLISVLERSIIEVFLKASAAPPILNSVLNSGAGDAVTVSWVANRGTKLKGYRLYYANDDLLTSWTLAANETILTSSMTSATLSPAQFINVPDENVYHFKLSAVVGDAPNADMESTWGNVYSRSSNIAGDKVLIVDGFYKSAGSYLKSSHTFVTNYFRALRDNANLQIGSASDEKVHDGTIDLKNYDIVVWFIGDESGAGVVFSAAEKNALKNFLHNGGKLLFSGSEAAYNLGRTGSASADLNFMNNYLKSIYVHDGSASFTPASGIAGTTFEGFTMPFGLIYTEDYPAIKGINGGVDILKYNSTLERVAGISYKGTFGSGTKAGAIIYLSFTLETARDKTMASFMQRAMQFFGVKGILPVTGLDLQVKVSGNKLNVTWTTLAEINTKEFEVQKSNDGIHFKEIGFKAAEGNRRTGRTYSVHDALSAAGKYYYRIKGIDHDGEVTFSQVHSIVYADAASMKVGPTPFSNTITVSNLSNVNRIELVDMNGRIALSKIVKNEHTVRLETNRLTAGTYQLKSYLNNDSFRLIKLFIL